MVLTVNRLAGDLASCRQLDLHPGIVQQLAQVVVLGAQALHFLCGGRNILGGKPQTVLVRTKFLLLTRNGFFFFDYLLRIKELIGNMAQKIHIGRIDILNQFA